MALDMKVHGPFDIDFDLSGRGGSAKHIDKPHKQAFLKMLDDEGMSGKQGCYIFALRAGKGFSPWYVGKATKGFRQECMSAAALNHYNAVFFKGIKGKPVMFFVAPDGGKKNGAASVCNDMETFLIQSAVHENPDLRNVQKTKVPAWSIGGIVRSGKGKPCAAAMALREMMGL